MATTLLTLFGGYGILQGLLFILHIATSHLRKVASNLLLAALNLLVILFLTESIFLFLSRQNNVHFSVLSLTALTLIGPLALLYCKVFINPSYRAGKTEVLYALSTIIPLLANQFAHLPYLLSVSIYIGACLAGCLYQVYAERASLSKNKKWWLLALIGCIMFVMIPTALYSLRCLCIVGISIGFSLAVYLVAYACFRFYKELFNSANTVRERGPMPGKDDYKELFKKLSEDIIQRKLYKDAELTLPKLASDLNVPLHRVSYSINYHSQKNFSEYINTFRIAEAKQLLTTTKTKVAAVAFECGFNSLSAFYTCFKNKEGVTPTEYRQTQQPV